jgi:glycosyltransferase involved in cell wall biosynthesis
MKGENKWPEVYYVFRKPNPLFFSIEKIFSQVGSILKKNGVSIKYMQVPHARLAPWNIIQNLLSLLRIKANVFHVTGDIHYAVLALPRKKTILTIHDCVFMGNPNRIKRLILKKLFLTWPVKRASIITTISEKSKGDIINYTGCVPDKIVVIPNPLDNRFRFYEKVFNSNCPVVLFIGSTPNKNLPRVISALKGINCILEVIGKIDTDLQQKLHEEQIQFRQSAAISDDQLVKKYIECDMVLFPSMYEGFGLPIIEAQQTGRPIITSNISPMKEVSGNAACLVDPYSVQSIREGILKVIQDDDYRNILIRDGLTNAKRYNPEEIANEYFLLYKRLMASSN